ATRRASPEPRGVCARNVRRPVLSRRRLVPTRARRVRIATLPGLVRGGRSCKSLPDFVREKVFVGVAAAYDLRAAVLPDERDGGKRAAVIWARLRGGGS